jgi:pyruvate formate lyase activating enzyme
MIFYKGCPLACKWCCNPESQSFSASLMYNSKLCKNFGDCLKQGEHAITSDEDGINIDRTLILHPEKFCNVCASKALLVSGEEKSVNELLFEIEKDMPFYEESGGGVTLSGGEPLSQGAEVISLLTELKNKKINVAIETCLHVTWENVERCIELTDTFLVDLKHTDPEKFREFTGGEADLVLTNLRKLADLHKNIIIRVPVIPEFNHSEQEMISIIDFTVSLQSIKEIHFLPFHNLGSEKYKMLGLEYYYSGKGTETLHATEKLHATSLKDYDDYAKSKGLVTKIGG